MEKESRKLQVSGSRFRFGIRTLLVAVFISSTSFAMYVPIKQRHQTIQKLRQHEFRIQFRENDQLNLLQRALVWLCGKDTTCPVDLVEAIEMDDPELVQAIARLTEVKHLNLMFCYEPLDYEPLRTLNNLQSLNAESILFEDVSFLSSFQELKVFSLFEGDIKKGLGAIGDLPKIEKVEIYSWDDLELSNEDFAKICEAKTLKQLNLGFSMQLSSVTDFQCIEQLENLVQLSGVLNPRDPKHEKYIELLPADCEVSYPD